VNFVDIGPRAGPFPLLGSTAHIYMDECCDLGIQRRTALAGARRRHPRRRLHRRAGAGRRRRRRVPGAVQRPADGCLLAGLCGAAPPRAGASTSTRPTPTPGWRPNGASSSGRTASPGAAATSRARSHCAARSPMCCGSCTGACPPAATGSRGRRRGPAGLLAGAGLPQLRPPRRRAGRRPRGGRQDRPCVRCGARCGR
jgi:hypothetical protein